MKHKGFVRYCEGTFSIDWRQTLSIIAGELLLEEILAARSYLRGRLLDVGCGKRPYALIYESLVETSIGTEVIFSPHGTAEADVICYAESLPFADGYFDTILCTEVLEHTREPFKVMREFARVLKPGGSVLLSVPFIYPIHEAPHDYWRFTAHGSEAVCRSAGLVPIYIHSKGGPLAAMLSLSINIIIRSVNALGKLLGLPRPLYEQIWLRWLLSLPQWVYLWFSRVLRSSKRVRWLGKTKGQISEWFSKTLQRPAWLYELNSWMTIGYVMLAQKPLTERESSH